MVLRRGNVERNTNDFSLLLWNSGEILRSLNPEHQLLLTMSSSSNRDAIDEPRWLGDGETMAFLGETPGESHQLYTFNIQTRALTRITNDPNNIHAFSISDDGTQLAYVTEDIEDIWTKSARRDGIVVSNQMLVDLVRGSSGSEFSDGGALYYQARGAVARRMTVLGVLPRWTAIPSLSPDGKHIVIVSRDTQTVHRGWNAYTQGGAPLLAVEKQDQYVLVDTANGTSRVLLDAPIRPYGAVAWSPDSKSVALSGVYLPLANVDDEDRPRRTAHMYAAEVSIVSGEIASVAEDDSANWDASRVAWDARTNHIIFDHEQRTEPAGLPVRVRSEYRKTGGRWVLVREHVPNGTPLQVDLEENVNTPPRLVALDVRRSRRIELLDLNPQFKDLRFARVEAIHWPARDGHEVNGGLYYPTAYKPGKRYPLVIQTHGWDPSRFWIDGPVSTAFAAQPLAGKGFFVLQADEITEPGYDTPLEVDREAAAIEGAIDYLDRRAFVDRQRVGVIGFSRTCLFVKFALTHSSYHFAAATVTDGVDGGYFQYLQAVNVNPSWAREFYEGTNGGNPFGPHIKSWIDRSPGFNLAHLNTPLLITALNPESLLMEWEWFAGSYRLGKPVEMTYLQDGQHALEKPSDRIASQGRTVDWFDFWLNGHEDRDSTGAEQYQRWEKLCDVQRMQNPNQVAFCVKSEH